MWIIRRNKIMFLWKTVHIYAKYFIYIKMYYT